MKENLTEKCDLFAENKKSVLKKFIWDDDYMSTVAAALFASLGQKVDADALKGAERILKENSKALSEFRSRAKLPILAEMIRSGDPEGCFENIKNVYGKLMGSKLLDSTERMMAALVIVRNSNPEKFDYYVERTLSIYNKMKEKHWFITDEMDIPYAALLAVSDIPEDKLISDMEESFNSLKKLFPMRSSNNLQALSQVLSLYADAPADKAARVKEFCEIMKEKDHKIPDGQVLPIYGSIAMLNGNLEQTADKLIETYDYLKTLDGMGFFSMDSYLRYIYASMMLLNSGESPLAVDVSDNAAMAAALVASITMQACLIACITSATMLSANSKV